MEYQQIDAPREKALEDGEIASELAVVSTRRSDGGHRLMAVAMTVSIAVSVCALVNSKSIQGAVGQVSVTGLMNKYGPEELGAAMAEAEALFNLTDNVSELAQADNHTFEDYEQQASNASVEDNLAYEQHLHIMETFATMDLDQNSSITVEEFVQALNSTPNFTMDSLMREVNNMDHDHSGTVEFVEFYEMMQNTTANVSQEAEKNSAFSVWDVNADGGIDLAEVKAWMTKFAPNMTMSDEKLEEHIKNGDRDKSGKIELEEFKVW